MVFNKLEVTIGRVQGNDIVLPKGNVSRHHARIVLKDGKLIIVDLKSTNGTYVNGRKITSPLVVKDSDKISIGDFIVGVDGAASAAGDGPSETTTLPPAGSIAPPVEVRPLRPTGAAPMPTMGGSDPMLGSDLTPTPTPMPRRPLRPGSAAASGREAGPPPIAPPVREPAMSPIPLSRPIPPRPVGGGTLPTPIAPAAEGAFGTRVPRRVEQLWSSVDPDSQDNAPRGPGSRQMALGAPQAEDVAVTVAHAPSVDRGRWHPLDVFVHVDSLEDEVNRLVRAERGRGAARGSRNARIPRGTVVRIEPRIELAEVDIEALEMRWLEDIQRATFRFRPCMGTTDLRGSVDLYVGRALLCSVPIAVMVLDEPRYAAPASIATARLMETVFVSYATEERPIVEHVTRPYRELGITVFMDKDFLHAGDTTGEALRTHIERADVFQLYWSARSSRKPWVEREWRHALALTGPAGRKGARFIRPLVWEQRPPPWPPELAAIQFGRLDAFWFEANVRPPPPLP